MLSYLWRILSKSSDDGAKQSISKFMDDEPPSIVNDALIRNFRSHPDQQLPAGWFNLCLSHCLKTHWPDVDDATAVCWLREYIGVKHGAQGFDWSYSAAKRVALE
ncbi:hypothetical protein [Agrobacterium burrii]|uniref:Uncharacterized protein n=1 Tax=Agrobacterium burrii TaxID=2815339 RepID=A0ABS3ERH9_9HYPH|nr:hypothetical protein [Agrobacterium burrii]MBO0134615.1 hypothetical protein [Agrobacterium burrii]